MWEKIFIRLLAIVYLVGGAAALVAPERVGKFARWFADNPRYMRLDGVLGIVLGIWLLRGQHQEQAPPRSWWQRLFGGYSHHGR